MNLFRRAPIVALLLAGACASSPSPGTAQAAPAEASLAVRLADAMADAAEAEARGDGKALARAVQVIDASGPQPLEGAPRDPLPAWRDAVRGEAGPPWRGRPLGPGYRSGKLSVGGRESFSQLFLSGSAATIALSAPTGDRLALRVLDPSAKPICTDESGRGGLCKWVPLFTQRYTIEVMNRGAGDARYFLVVQ
ncbi:hypothetical protein [Novosphingobium sp. TH158]|uniref:hypothetical protein n=1 Tax=Novosphingobium sp. TH158 TaxID=2067455 RepID=UPI000C7DDAA4|nr:hypothetical protein [Novosphingobium sp. TH158]PLK26908.1 hypothetical protein C0V78_08420 [Novosphingobium sp. TH158]